ncbi:hypothetical protein [Chryseobacterium wanjuense]
MMDVDNTNGGKYDFWITDKNPYQYYYKNFLTYLISNRTILILPLIIIKKPWIFHPTKNKKARVLFPDGQCRTKENTISTKLKILQKLIISDPKWSEKSDAYQKQLDQIKIKNTEPILLC